MKTIILFSFILFLSITVVSQGLFTTLTEKYAAQEGFSATNLTKDMFELYLKKKQVEPNSPAYETLKKLDNILVVSYTSLPQEKTNPVKTPVSVSDMQKIVLDFFSVGFIVLVFQEVVTVQLCGYPNNVVTIEEVSKGTHVFGLDIRYGMLPIKEADDKKEFIGKENHALSDPSGIPEAYHPPSFHLDGKDFNIAELWVIHRTNTLYCSVIPHALRKPRFLLF